MTSREGGALRHNRLVVPAREGNVTDRDVDIAARILAEYREMPGLALTAAQTVRLCNVEPERCCRLLEHLVDEGRLRLSMGRYYVLASPLP